MSKAKDTVMRAKLEVTGLTNQTGTDGAVTGQTLTMIPVPKSTAYPEDGSDEDNTFAKFSPGGQFQLFIANPALFDKLAVGAKFYADFTPAD